VPYLSRVHKLSAHDEPTEGYRRVPGRRKREQLSKKERERERVLIEKGCNDSVQYFYVTPIFVYTLNTAYRELRELFANKGML